MINSLNNFEKFHKPMKIFYLLLIFKNLNYFTKTALFSKYLVIFRNSHSFFKNPTIIWNPHYFWKFTICTLFKILSSFSFYFIYIRTLNNSHTHTHSHLILKYSFVYKYYTMNFLIISTWRITSELQNLSCNLSLFLYERHEISP